MGNFQAGNKHSEGQLTPISFPFCFAYMYVCVYMRVYVYMHICIYVYAYTHTHAHIYWLPFSLFKCANLAKGTTLEKWHT